MKQLKKQLKETALLLLAACLFVSCSKKEDETSATKLKTTLYAIVKPQGAQLTNITPDDYVLTLDDFVAVNPESGVFRLVNTKRIDSVAYPIPTQYVIQFYTNGSFLFEAKLNSVISSYLPTGLTFCHFLSDKNGVARYDLQIVNLSHGKVGEGTPTQQEKEGMERMYQLLKKAGKTTNDSNIGTDFEF